MNFGPENITICVTQSGSATIVINEGSCMSFQLHRPCIISEREKAAVGGSNLKRRETHDGRRISCSS